MKAVVVLGLSLLTTVQILGFGQDHAEEISPGFGGIEGKILDATDHPVGHAEVYATNKERPTGRQAMTYTDMNGNFYLRRVLAGTNMVHVSNEAAGYPDTYFAFFDQGPEARPEVSVQAGLVTRGLIVRLGAKGGTLLGKVLDARSQRPVVNATIILTRRDNAKNYFSTGPEYPDATFHILVPPVRFTMRVLAAGYEDWSLGSPISIGSQQSKEIVVLLRPIAKPQK